MSDTMKNYIVVLLPALLLCGLLLTALILPDAEYSMSERRVLAKLPKATKETVASGRFMTDFEDYTLDQFPMRDLFRSLKAVSGRYLLGQRDNHGYYLAQGHLSKLEYPLNEKRLDKSVRQQQNIYESYLKGTDCRIFFASVPDKNYFLARENGYPAMDYDAYLEKVRGGVPYASHISLYDCLSLEDYYRTDQHWKQESLRAVVERLGGEMGFSVPWDFEERTLDVPFYGAYYAQASLPAKPDRLTYLTDDAMEACTVTSYNTGMPKQVKMVDEEKAAERDPYEMFLNGSDALLVIESPNAGSGRELVIFRDSFGSSLVPLLTSAYAKITVIDLRYVRSEVLGQFVAFDEQDVLFLYSSLVF